MVREGGTRKARLRMRAGIRRLNREGERESTKGELMMPVDNVLEMMGTFQLMRSWPRLELLRKTVPHSERSNTACFLEEVIKYIDNLKTRVVELEELLQAQNIRVPKAIDPSLGPSFEEMREVQSSRSGDQARQSELTTSIRPSPLVSNAPQLQFPMGSGGLQVRKETLPSLPSRHLE